MFRLHPDLAPVPRKYKAAMIGTMRRANHKHTDKSPMFPPT